MINLQLGKLMLVTYAQHRHRLTSHKLRFIHSGLPTGDHDQVHARVAKATVSQLRTR